MNQSKGAPRFLLEVREQEGGPGQEHYLLMDVVDHTLCVYDGQGLLRYVEYPGRQRLAFAYGSEGLERITTPLGNVLEVECRGGRRKTITLDSTPELPGPVIREQLLLPDLRESGYKSLADIMSLEEAARYEAHFTKDAPDMVIPGIKELEGIHLHHNNLTGVDEIQPWRAYYDAYGRLMARTDYNAENKTAKIPNVHYHLYEWGRRFSDWKKPHEYASHLEGEFR